MLMPPPLLVKSVGRCLSLRLCVHAVVGNKVGLGKRKDFINVDGNVHLVQSASLSFSLMCVCAVAKASETGEGV